MSDARPIDTLLAQYRDSHRHHSNEIIHYVCVPLIVLSLLGLLWAAQPLLAIAATLAALAYYVKLSKSFAVGMLLMSTMMLALLAALPGPLIMPLSLTIFVLAWIGQFIGHKIEGKKPSFFDDVRFLLIGPLFVLAVLYRRWQLTY